jgi:hypothetical protein
MAEVNPVQAPSPHQTEENRKEEHVSKLNVFTGKELLVKRIGRIRAWHGICWLKEQPFP